MDIILDMLVHRCVYYAPAGQNEFGRNAYHDPVEMACRWETSSEAVVTPGGETVVSRSKVYVDRDLVEGGLLRKCVLSVAPPATNPFQTPGTWEIRKFGTTDTLDGEETVRMAWL